MSENTFPDKTIAAGIDIGSNSVRMIIAEVQGHEILRILSSHRESSRLASGIFQTKRIADGPFNKSIEILKNYKAQLDKFGVTKVKTVATSAVREAENGNDFIIACEEIGVHAEIITGNIEAKLCLCGVRAGVKNTGDKIMIFDTGGGSTEFIAAEQNRIFFNESYKIGVVKLTDMFDMKDGAAANLESCAKYVADFFKIAAVPQNIDTLIGTAGTAASLAAISMGLTTYEPSKINGYSITKNEISEILNTIVNTPYSKRILIKGLEKGREDLMIPGILITLEAMKKARFETLVVSDYGLREGAVVVAANS